MSANTSDDVFIKDFEFLTAIGNTPNELLQKFRAKCSGIENIKQSQMLPGNFPASLGAAVLLDEIEIFDEFRELYDLRYNRNLKYFAKKIRDLYQRNGEFDKIYISFGRGYNEFLSKVGNNNSFVSLGTNEMIYRILSFAGIKTPKEDIIIVKSACSTGIIMLNSAIRMLEQGKNKKILLLGIESSLCWENLIDLVKLGAVSLQEDHRLGCLPFNKNRNGLVKGEAFVGLVLEKFQNQRVRFGEVKLRAGFSNGDGAGLTDGREDGREIIKCLERTLSETEIQNLDAFCVHGTSTILNDRIETKAINSFFKNRKDPILAIALKGYFGHTLDSSGLLETLVCTLLMKNNFVPALLNDFDADSIEKFYFSTEPIDKELNSLCKLSVGFGGINSTIFLEKCL